MVRLSGIYTSTDYLAYIHLHTHVVVLKGSKPNTHKHTDEVSQIIYVVPQTRIDHGGWLDNHAIYGQRGTVTVVLGRWRWASCLWG